MVHIHTQGVLRISSSMPKAAILRNFRGSISSKPVAGHPEEQAPQVKQRLRFPPSGRSFLTLSKKTLSFLPLIVMGSPGIVSSYFFFFN
jgi:hypothetical protein